MNAVPFLHDNQAEGGEASEARSLPLPYSVGCFELCSVLLAKALEGSYSLSEIREMNDLAVQSNDSRGILFTQILICVMECVSEQILALPTWDR